MANRFERIQVLRQLADTDPLTGLANRRQSLEQLDHHLQAASRFREPFCQVGQTVCARRMQLPPAFRHGLDPAPMSLPSTPR